MNSFGYHLLYLLHLSAVIVGFGSSFVWPAMARKARGLEPKQAYTLSHAALGLSDSFTKIPVLAAGLFGILLIVASDKVYEFKQTWVSIAFLLWLAMILIAVLLHTPNLKAMDALGEKLASGNITPSKKGGPPKEVVEIEERGKKAGAFGGSLHLLWLLLMIDMIWKPGF